MDPHAIVDALDALGSVGLLAVIVWGGYRGWYVFRETHDDMRKQRDEWKDLALREGRLIDRYIRTKARGV